MSAAIALWWRLPIFLVVGVAAGISNGLAGGGTFLTFPTMIGLGLPALEANVSSTVGVIPSYLGVLRGFRHRIESHADLIKTLVIPSVLGSFAGCALLLLGSPATFRAVVPYLIGIATLVFAASPWITKRLAHLDHHHGVRRRGLLFGIFVAATYGGYFGAGVGIVLLAVLAVGLPFDIHELQGLRSVLALVITTSASIVFLIRGHLAWDAVGATAVGTLLGGWLGAMLMRRLSPLVVRTLVVTTGLATTVHLFLAN